MKAANVANGSVVGHFNVGQINPTASRRAGRGIHIREAPGAWRVSGLKHSTTVRRLLQRSWLTWLAKFGGRKLRGEKEPATGKSSWLQQSPLKPLEIDGLGMVAVGLVWLMIVGSVFMQIAVLKDSDGPGRRDSSVLQVRARTLEEANGQPAELGGETTASIADRFDPLPYGYVVDNGGLRIPLPRTTPEEPKSADRFTLGSWAQSGTEFEAGDEPFSRAGLPSGVTSWEMVRQLAIHPLDPDADSPSKAEFQTDQDEPLKESAAGTLLASLRMDGN